MNALLEQYKRIAIDRWPELASRHQFKKIRLIYCDENKQVMGQAWRSSSTIEINLFYGKHEEVLVHELAHIIAPLLYGNKAENHGKYWKAVMREFGFNPSTHLDL